MTPRILKALIGVMAKLCLVAAAWPAAAKGGLTVAPITVEFAADGGARAIEVSNPGDEPVSVQVRLFDWNVDRDGEHYAPSRAIGFSPPMFTLQPGATQVVRLAPQTRTAERERAYRLFVDQVVEAAAPGQVKMPVRMVLPVFAAPAGGYDRASSTLAWRLEFDRRSNESVLLAANSGARRVRLADLAVEIEGKTHMLRPGLAGYVLAGQEFGWRFAAPQRHQAIRITAKTEDGPVHASLSFPAD